jgi:hypothetical protein
MFRTGYAVDQPTKDIMTSVQIAVLSALPEGQIIADLEPQKSIASGN